LQGAPTESAALEDDCEIVSLVATLSADGAHLHASVSDPRGSVRGGHVQIAYRERVAGSEHTAYHVPAPHTLPWSWHSPLKPFAPSALASSVLAPAPSDP
jgi:hypothetical protein